MLRKVQSALFVDFENVQLAKEPKALAGLVAWLEDGLFDKRTDKPRRRKLVIRRVYWNASSEVLREVFEKAGFEVVLCPKFAGLRNGADIRIAIDVAESCHRRPAIEEYILFTTDSDFVPVLQRLDEHRKTSAILVNENELQKHTTFHIHADMVIPRRRLGEAYAYERNKRGLLGGLLGRKKGPVASQGDSKTLEREPAAKDPVAEAEKIVVRVASRKPKKYTTRKSIERALKEAVPDFVKSGIGAYFGLGTYCALMQELAKRNSTLQVYKGDNGSASVMYVPPNEPEVAA